MFSITRLCRIIDLTKHCKRFSSALYITGDKAHETFSVLTPHLDFEERLNNKQELENNLKYRGIDTNLDDIIRLWNFYKHIESKKVSLEESKISISRTITNLNKKGDKYADKINTLKAHGKMVKEDLKTLKESFWSVEEKAALRVLELPNVLHPKTPRNEPCIIHKFLNKTEISSKSHLEIAQKFDFIEYNSPYNYYLKNDAALFELAATFYLSDKLLNNNYLQFSNSDFSRSVVVEGCGLNFSDPARVFTIKEEANEVKHDNSRLHLTGGASLSAFMAYFCRHTIFPSILPMKYFTTGRKYQPITSDTNSLFNVTQETACNLFIATKDDTNEMTKHYENVLKNIIDIYESLNMHFRVSLLPAKDLEIWECLRASFEVFSPHLNKYVEVGNISLCGNYVSKRLLFNYGKGIDMKFPCVITGTVLSVPKLLGCIIESNIDENCLLPAVFKQYVDL